jgi:hypothetical protein
MLDPNTSRTLRIYPLETVTRWDVSFGLLLHLDQKVIVFAIYLVISFTNFYGILMQVLDSSIFAFWSKSSVDFEARRIRLKSNSYTTNTILDTVTAASVQFKEMGGSSISRSRAIADAAKPPEQQNDRRKNFLDWRNLMKPMNEEKDHWVSSFCIGLKVFLYFGIQNDTLVSCNSFIACLSVMLHFTYHDIVFGDSNLPSRLEYQLLRQMNAKISMYTSFLPFLYVYGLKAFTQLPFYVYMLNC